MMDREERLSRALSLFAAGDDDENIEMLYRYFSSVDDPHWELLSLEIKTGTRKNQESFLEDFQKMIREELGEGPLQDTEGEEGGGEMKKKSQLGKLEALQSPGGGVSGAVVAALRNLKEGGVSPEQVVEKLRSRGLQDKKVSQIHLEENLLRLWPHL